MKIKKKRTISLKLMTSYIFERRRKTHAQFPIMDWYIKSRDWAMETEEKY